MGILSGSEAADHSNHPEAEDVQLDPGSKIHIPGESDLFKPTADIKTCFNLIDSHKPKAGKPPLFILVVGPTGCGKTTAAKVKAHKDKRHMLVVDCSSAQEPTDLFGSMTAKEGTTDFVLSDLPKAANIPNAIIVLDEVNRATHDVRNALLALLDGRGETTIPGVVDSSGNSVHINVRPDVIIMATANIGSGFVGTNKIDTAFRNRAKATIRVDYLSLVEEAKLLINRHGITADQAKAISALSDWTRKEAAKPTGGVIADPVATRTSLYVADMVSEGVPTKEAIQVGMINSYDDAEDRQNIEKQFADILGAMKLSV